MGNAIIGIGLLVGAVFGVAIEIVIGAAGVLFGAFNLINAHRRQVKARLTYLVLIGAVYIGGHIIIAYLCPVYFSYVTCFWALGFSGLVLLGLWCLGGWPLDLMIVICALPDEDFSKLMAALAKKTVTLEVRRTKPGWYDLLGQVSFHLHNTLGYSRDTVLASLRVILPLWRAFGKEFLKFLKFIFMVSMLVGMYFLYFPPSNNWRMFWVLLVSFTAYAISGPGFNWARWQKVSLASIVVCVAVTTLTPLASHIPSISLNSVDEWDYVNWIELAVALVALCVVLVFVGKIVYIIANSSKASAEPQTQQQGVTHASQH